MAVKMFILLLAAAVVLWIPAALDADLGRYESGIIRTAFMNGCVRVLDWDLERIRYLKEHPDEVRKQVEAVADAYVQQVQRLNPAPYDLEPVPSDRRKGRKGGWLW